MERWANARARVPSASNFLPPNRSRARAIITRLFRASRWDARKCQQPPAPPLAHPCGSSLTPPPPPPSDKNRLPHPSHPLHHHRRQPFVISPPLSSAGCENLSCGSRDSSQAAGNTIVWWRARQSLSANIIYRPPRSRHRRRRRDLVCARALTHAHVRSPPLDPFTSTLPPPPPSFSLGNKKRARRFRPAAHGVGRLARGARSNNTLPDYYCMRCTTVLPPAVRLVRAHFFTRVPPKTWCRTLLR